MNAHTPPLNWRNGYTMRDAIEAGVYYRVSIPSCASGGWDVAADSPAEAALAVGCECERHAYRRPPAMQTEVFRHLPQSRIGSAFLESCGMHQTLTSDHYVI